MPNTTRDRRLYGLIYLALFLSIGHHIDHAIRGNHVGWPLTAEVNAFTYSLMTPILIGLVLYRSGRVGPGFWVFLSGGGAVFAAIHFGPWAVEPRRHHRQLPAPILGWLAFGWLLLFLAVLGLQREARQWLRERRLSQAA